MAILGSAPSPGVLLDIAGQARGTAPFISTSDRRFKKNIVELQGSLGKVMNLTGVSYNWRVDEFPQKNFSDEAQLGFIAQDVEKVVPELVHTDSGGWKSIAYATLTPVLVEAVKSQQHQMEELTNQIDKQQAQIAEQQLQIAEQIRSSSKQQEQSDKQQSQIAEQQLQIAELASLLKRVLVLGPGNSAEDAGVSAAG